jgi:hypothetical protein
MNTTISSAPVGTHYGASFYAIIRTIWLNFAPTPPVPVTKCKASRRGYKTLNLDHKPRRISYSQVTELERNRIDFWEHKRGSESEEARKEQEALERAAGKISLASIFEAAPKDCSKCGEVIAGDAKWFVDVSVELHGAGINVKAVERVAVHCQKCHGGEPVSSKSESSEEEESWIEALTPNERHAHRLREQGLNQDEISKRMGKHQTTVGRWLKNTDVKEKSAWSQKYQATGGA